MVFRWLKNLFSPALPPQAVEVPEILENERSAVFAKFSFFDETYKDLISEILVLQDFADHLSIIVEDLVKQRDVHCSDVELKEVKGLFDSARREKKSAGEIKALEREYTSLRAKWARDEQHRRKIESDFKESSAQLDGAIKKFDAKLTALKGFFIKEMSGLVSDVKVLDVFFNEFRETYGFPSRIDDFGRWNPRHRSVIVR